MEHKQIAISDIYLNLLFSCHLCPNLFKDLVQIESHIQSSFSQAGAQFLVQIKSKSTPVLVYLWSSFHPILGQFWSSYSQGFGPDLVQGLSRYQPAFCPVLVLVLFWSSSSQGFSRFSVWEFNCSMWKLMNQIIIISPTRSVFLGSLKDSHKLSIHFWLNLKC